MDELGLTQGSCRCRRSCMSWVDEWGRSIIHSVTGRIFV